MSPSAKSSSPRSSSRSSRRPEWLNRVVWICVFCVVVAAATGYGIYALAQHLHPVELNAVVTLRAQGTPGVQVTSRKLQACAATIEARLSKLELSSFKITTEGEDKIVVALPEGTDVEAVAAVILQRGYLRFYGATAFGTKYATAAEALAAAGVTAEDELPSGTSLIFWPADGWLKDTDEYYLVTAPSVVTGEMLRGARYDDQTAPDTYSVTVEFNEEGTALLARVTKDLAAAGASTGVAQQLVIVLDGLVYSALTVNKEVSGGSVEITGDFTLQEAKDLVAVLQGGAMPLELVQAQ